HRTHVQNRAATLVFEKMLHGGPVRIHQRGQVLVNGVAPAFVGQFVQRAVALPPSAAARDMIQPVEAVEVSCCDIDRGGCTPGVRGVGGKAHHVAAQFLLGGFDLGTVPPDDNDLRARRQKRPRGGESQPAGAPDDDERFVFKRQGRHVWLRLMKAGQQRQISMNETTVSLPSLQNKSACAASKCVTKHQFEMQPNMNARLTAILTAALLAVLASPTLRASSGDWPQWRGPDRTDVSKETGLLKSWPEGGPKRVWLFDK